MNDLVLSIDQGTTNTTVALFDTQCKLKAKAIYGIRQSFPHPGWVECDLEDIWQSVLRGICSVLDIAGACGNEIRAIGITNQRETTCLWERKNARPLYNAICWQCRRTTLICQQIKRAGYEPLFSERTGLVVDPYFSGTKLKWLLDNVAYAREHAQHGKVCFGTIDTFLLYRLTGSYVHATDVSNASRTLMMNIENLTWDHELLSILDIPKAMLPCICSSSEVYGFTKGLEILPDKIPICGIAGDQQAALFGQKCFAHGDTKCTYGTGAFVLMNTGTHLFRSKEGLLTTVAWKINDRVVYALEGSVFIAGAAVQWLRDGLGIIKNIEDVEKLAASVNSTEGVVFVPSLVGMGAPYWNPNARGVICGITRGTTRAHLARATLEGIAFQVYDVIAAMSTATSNVLGLVRVDGGGSQNDILLQFQADILGKEIERPQVIETTCLGAALLAGLGVGMWKDIDEIRETLIPSKHFSPKLNAKAIRDHLARWESARAKA